MRAAIVGLLFLLGCGGPSELPHVTDVSQFTPAQREEMKRQAVDESKKEVLLLLKSPSSAKFVAGSRQFAKQADYAKNSATVVSQVAVDAANSFNAMIRETYDVEMTYGLQSKTWALRAIRQDGLITKASPEFQAELDAMYAKDHEEYLRQLKAAAGK